MKSVQWREMSDEEQASFEFKPLPRVNVRLDELPFDIYVLAEEAVLSGPDGQCVVPSGERIKVLEDSWTGESWVYEVIQVTVRLPGGSTASLKKGTKIAVLQENYKEQLKSHVHGL